MEVDYPPAEVGVAMNAQQVAQHDLDGDSTSSAENEDGFRSMSPVFRKERTPAPSSKLKAAQNETKATGGYGGESSAEVPEKPNAIQSADAPLQSDSSTSPTLPRSDSSSSQQQQQQQQQRATLTPTPTYNPYSHYSPARSRLRERFSLTSVLDRSPIPATYNYPMYRRPAGSGEDSSMDSDEALERWAKQIRIELRHAEMVELAIEAERAAEAGEEHFAGKPSTFGLDDADAAIMLPNRPTDLIRRGSYSEGTRIPMLRRQPHKIGILALRDVDEVFPSFRQFHTHLRTHFERSHVDETTLVYHEVKESPKVEEVPSRRRKIMSPQRRKREEIGFLKNFNLEQWVGKHNAVGNGSTSNHQENVGDLLAGHITAPHGPAAFRVARGVEPPPGLELPDISASATRPPPSLFRKHDEGTDTRPALFAPEPPPQTPGATSKRALSPKALFDQDIESSDTEDEPVRFTVTPKTSHRRTSSMPDFVTPVRLRDIRNLDQKELAAAEDVGLPLLVSSNTMIEGTPSTPPDLCFKGNPQTGDSSNSLLLPTFKRRDQARDLALFDDQLWLKPTNSRDAVENVTIERSSSTTRPLELPILIDERTSSPLAPPNGSDLNAGRVENLQVDDPVRDANNRMVRVSILDRVQAGEVSPTVEVSPMMELVTRDVPHPPLLSVLELDSNSKKDDSEQVAELNCSCLTLSPASSVDSAESFRSESAARQAKDVQLINQIRKSTSTGNLQARTERSIWNPCVAEKKENEPVKGQVARKSFRAAMDMIATLSPGKELFLQKRSALYVRPEANDDFLHNYMYCSKPKDVEVQPEIPMCVEPCQDTTAMCGDLHMDMCCVSILADTALKMGPRRTSTSSQLLSLSREASYAKLEPESWFDMANERFDCVLDQLVGSANHHGSQWNVSFQAPGLKKNPGSHAKRPRPEPPSSPPPQEMLNTNGTSGTGVDPSNPQPLFEEPHETLSDTQFHLIFGISREEFAAVNSDGANVALQTGTTPATPGDAAPDGVFANKSY